MDIPVIEGWLPTVEIPLNPPFQREARRNMPRVGLQCCMLYGHFISGNENYWVDMKKASHDGVVSVTWYKFIKPWRA